MSLLISNGIKTFNKKERVTFNMYEIPVVNFYQIFTIPRRAFSFQKMTEFISSNPSKSHPQLPLVVSTVASTLIFTQPAGCFTHFLMNSDCWLALLESNFLPISEVVLLLLQLCFFLTGAGCWYSSIFCHFLPSKFSHTT